jgi:hypothetical protein
MNVVILKASLVRCNVQLHRPGIDRPLQPRKEEGYLGRSQ